MRARRVPVRVAGWPERGPLAKPPGLAKRCRDAAAQQRRLASVVRLPTLTIMDKSLALSGATPPAPLVAHARFAIGEVVRHRMLEIRGVIFDVDPVFANSDEWYDSIPEDIRPSKDQPFYHLLAENAESSYVAYVSQQNLIADESEEPIDHPAIPGLFDDYAGGRYRLRREHRH